MIAVGRRMVNFWDNDGFIRILFFKLIKLKGFD